MNNKEWKKLKEGRLVKITWNDAWHRVTASDLIGPIKVWIVGWVVYVDKEGVKICSERSEFDHHRHEYYVPRKMVEKVRVME